MKIGATYEFTYPEDMLPDGHPGLTVRYVVMSYKYLRGQPSTYNIQMEDGGTDVFVENSPFHLGSVEVKR